MVATPFKELTDEWQAGKSYTATGDTPIKLSNPTNYFAFWTLKNAGLPAVPVREANPVGPMTSPPGFILEDGETIYFGGSDAMVNLETGE